MSADVLNSLDAFKKDYPEAQALFDQKKLTQPIKEIKVFFPIFLQSKFIY